MISGFTATQLTTEVKVVTHVYDIGIYIDTYIDGVLKDRTTRNTVSKVNNYLNKVAKSLEDRGFTINYLEETIIIENNSLPKFVIKK